MSSENSSKTTFLIAEVITPILQKNINDAVSVFKNAEQALRAKSILLWNQVFDILIFTHL